MRDASFPAVTPLLDVLIVDDDPSTRSALALLIEGMGHRCRQASDGEAAWAMLADEPADVVLSDWQMPNLTGPDLCRRLRKVGEEGRYTYFILMTGLEDRALLLEGMMAGADAFERKPVDFGELEAQLVAASRVVTLHRRLGERTRRLRRDSQNHYTASRTDALTGIGNRLRLMEDLAAAWARAERYGHRYTVGVLDVDRFKQLNDAYGHLAGDDALKAIARTLRTHLRSGDVVYRYGGDELVVLLPEQTLDDARLVLERMRAAVAALGLQTPAGVVSVSVGLAELDPKRDASADAWLSRADAALYEAKRRGRNRLAEA